MIKTYRSWRDVITIHDYAKNIISEYLESDNILENFPHDMPAVLRLLKVCFAEEVSMFLEHLSDSTYLNYVADKPAPYTDRETLCDIKHALQQNLGWGSIKYTYYISYAGYKEFLDELDPSEVHLIGLYEGGHFPLLYSRLRIHSAESKGELLKLCIAIGDNRFAKHLLIADTNLYQAFVYAIHYRNKGILEHLFPQEKDFYKLIKTRDYIDIDYLFFALGTEAIMLRFHDVRIFTECMNILKDIEFPLDRDYCAEILEDNGRFDLSNIINRIVT